MLLALPAAGGAEKATAINEQTTAFVGNRVAIVTNADARDKVAGEVLRLTKLKPFGGFCAETGAASMLFLASALGIPVSTTHTITGAIVGVGWVNKPAGVRWGVALRIVWAWLFTIQSAALIAAALYFLARFVGIK